MPAFLVFSQASFFPFHASCFSGPGKRKPCCLLLLLLAQRPARPPLSSNFLLPAPQTPIWLLYLSVNYQNKSSYWRALLPSINTWTDDSQPRDALTPSRWLAVSIDTGLSHLRLKAGMLEVEQILSRMPVVSRSKSTCTNTSFFCCLNKQLSPHQLSWAREIAKAPPIQAWKPDFSTQNPCEKVKKNNSRKLPSVLHTHTLAHTPTRAHTACACIWLYIKFGPVR